ncbi:MAG: fructose PTS transporter subunit IIA [Nitrospinota bacterium]|nr:fructose PTS transporter subunit IIA [Nitrospinota bacterium]
MEQGLNILLLIGIGIFFGIGGGKIFQKLKIPQVVGYIIIGVIVGDSMLGLFSKDIITLLTPINSFALGIIGFMIGGELKIDLFKKYGKEFFIILLWEGMATFILVTWVITWYTGKLYIGVLFGALASATAPAATVDVLWEYKTKGMLTTTILAIVALDDGLALILYGFASAFAKTLMTGHKFDFVHGVLMPIKEISLAVALGIIIGYVIYLLLLRITDREQILVLAIGAILVNTGLAALFRLDLILSNMALGIFLSNRAPHLSKAIFEEVKGITPPIYVLFFVLVGARLQLNLIPKMGVLGLLYILFRIIGKLGGSYVGAVHAKSAEAVRKYLGVTLFSQAGVAIGLAIAIYQTFSTLGPEGERVGNLVINVIAGTTFFVQMIGPPCVKYGVSKAGEIGKDVSAEDVFALHTVKDIMDRGVKLIHTNQKLKEVISTIRNSMHSHFPLVNNNMEFLGVISFNNVKDIMFEKELENLVSAEDIIPDTVYTTTPQESLKSAMDKFIFETIDFLPVLESEESNKFIGILHKKKVMALSQHKVIDQITSNIAESSGSGGTGIKELLQKENIIVDLKVADKREAINKMIALAGEDISDKEEIAEAILERESQISTAIGEGIAIPHIRSKKAKKTFLAFARSKTGLEFEAIDGQPVNLIFMIVVPDTKRDEMLKVMGKLSRLLKDKKVRDSLLSADNAEDIMSVIDKAGAEAKS